MVRLGCEVASAFDVLAGVRQGCVLSPGLFALFIADLPQFLAQRRHADGGNTCLAGYQLFGNTRLTCVCFADDTATGDSNLREAQHTLDNLYAYCAQPPCEVRVNIGKTKYMVVNPKGSEVFDHGQHQATVVGPPGLPKLEDIVLRAMATKS